MPFFNNTYKRLFGRSKYNFNPLRNNDSITNKVVNPPKFPKTRFSWKPSAHNEVMRKRVVQEPLNMSIYSYFPTPKKGSTRRNNIWNVNWNKAQNPVVKSSAKSTENLGTIAKYMGLPNTKKVRTTLQRELDSIEMKRGPPPPSGRRNMDTPNNQRAVRPNIHELFAPIPAANFSRFDPFTGSNTFSENAFTRNRTRNNKKPIAASKGLIKALQRHGIRVPRQLPRNLRKS